MKGRSWAGLGCLPAYGRAQGSAHPTAYYSPFQLGVQSCDLPGGFLKLSHQLVPLTV